MSSTPNSNKISGNALNLAILGGTPVRQKPFDYYPIFDNNEEEAVKKLMESRKLSGFFRDFLGGEKVQEFEKAFAGYFGMKHCIAVNSGTSALHAAIASLGIGPGDEVIVPAYTFTATASAVVMNNAVPVFCDIKDDFTADPEDIERKITPHTKAIIPVHLFGKVCDMEKIMETAKKHNLFVIEDACQSPGSRLGKNGKLAGTFGDLACFSTVETKNIVTGEGGLITTNNDEYAEKCRMVRNHGEAWTRGKPRAYLSNMLGYNFRMTEFEAVIGIEQIKKLDRLNKIRNENAAFLLKRLCKINQLKMPEIGDGQAIHLLCLQYDENKSKVPKEKVVEALRKEGINISLGYPHPLYMNPLFMEKIAFGDKGCPFKCPFYNGSVKYEKGMCPNTEKIIRNAVWIMDIRAPNTLADMEDIAKAFEKVFGSLNMLKDVKINE